MLPLPVLRRLCPAQSERLLLHSATTAQSEWSGDTLVVDFRTSGFRLSFQNLPSLEVEAL